MVMIKDGISIQHSMLDFHKGNTSSRKNNLKGILSTFMLAPLSIINSYGSWYIEGRYRSNYVSYFPVVYSTISR